jgi:hypothetical protein
MMKTLQEGVELHAAADHGLAVARPRPLSVGVQQTTRDSMPHAT